MIDRRIGKIKIRRGTDSQRTSIVFPEGELLYTTDKNRVYIGDGTTSGGVFISNKNHISTTIETLPYNALYGDIIHNRSDSTTYIVGSADDGSLSAIWIGGLFRCDNLKIQLENLKNRVVEILACVNNLKPTKPTTTNLQFVIQPSDVSVNVGETAVFSASAVGSGVITYQWYRVDTGIIAGAIDTKFIISKTQISDISNYYCVANSSILGNLNSERASLTIGGNSILSDPNGNYILSESVDYIDWTATDSTIL
jgi:hypothetical protein